MISHRMNATTLNQNTIKFIPFAVEKIYDNNTATSGWTDENENRIKI